MGLFDKKEDIKNLTLEKLEEIKKLWDRYQELGAQALKITTILEKISTSKLETNLNLKVLSDKKPTEGGDNETETFDTEDCGIGLRLSGSSIGRMLHTMQSGGSVEDFMRSEKERLLKDNKPTTKSSKKEEFSIDENLSDLEAIAILEVLLNTKLKSKEIIKDKLTKLGFKF